MKYEDKKESLDNTNSFLEDTLINLDLNSDLEKMYEIINDDKLYNDFENTVNLSNLRNENYKKYVDINILKYRNLSDDFSDVSSDIIELYDSLDIKEILSENLEDAKNTKIVLDNIYKRITRLDSMVKSNLKEITSENDDKQKKFNLKYFENLEINEELKKELIIKYNDLVLHSASFSEDIYEELENQEKRKNYIDEIYKLLSLESVNKLKDTNKKRLIELNSKINLEIINYNEKIKYLEDIIPEGSKHLNEFLNFVDFYKKIIAYDDTDYENARQTYDILSDGERFNNYIVSFENLFIDEIESNIKEEKFIYNKVGKKNILNSIDYISNNYLDKLSEGEKISFASICNEINNDNCDLEKLNKSLRLIVNRIWKDEITDTYSFNPNEDYKFICANNQFRDPKYQTILITKNEINRVNDYEDYQIGFICNYNDNILYITENDDIMTVDHDDMSNLKTPAQLEKEFINFKVCNRIALNGYMTSISAVYLISDGNMQKYFKALELANMYNLPLIELKKS